MDENQDFRSGARPKRQIHLPQRYEDYKLDFIGSNSYQHRVERGRMATQEGLVEKIPPTSPYASPTVAEAPVLSKPITHYARGSLLQSQEEQLTQSLVNEGRPAGSWRHPTAHNTLPPTSNEAMYLRSELKDLQHERFLLQQSQQCISADLVQLRAIQTDMLQIMRVTHENQQEQLKGAACVQPPDPPVNNEDEEWPLPPPPVCMTEEEAEEETPVLERLDKIMSELQILKGEALLTKHSQLSAQPVNQMASVYQQTRNDCQTSSPSPPVAPWQGASANSFATTTPRFSSTPYRPMSIQAALPQQPVQQTPLQQTSRAPQINAPNSGPPYQSSSSDTAYHGPRPTIPNLYHRDPGEFAHLKMALENLLPAESPELFKYQVLVDHLKLEDARLVAEAYLHSPTPFTDTMTALNEKFGQPHQLALSRIATVMDSPDIRRGDVIAFEKFSLQIQSLVGMLKTLGSEGEVELYCGSHVARLLGKLPPEQRAEFRRCMFKRSGRNHTLIDLSDWLKYESWCQDYDGQLPARVLREKPNSWKGEGRLGKRSVAVLHGADNLSQGIKLPSISPNKAKPPSYCAFCDVKDHHLSQCAGISQLTKEQLADWIRTNKRCWRCARAHHAAQCNLKKSCNLCRGRHLQVLHDVNTGPAKGQLPASLSQGRSENPTGVLYLDRPTEGSRVLLKVVPVLLRHGDRTLETYAVLDDGSERSMLLPSAAQKLGLQGTPECLPLRTIRQDVQTLNGSCVSFIISPRTQQKTQYCIHNAFTTECIDLADHTYPVDSLKKKYRHLTGLPIQPFKKIKPLLLIGSDHPHLITPTEPVRLGPPGGPAAVHTRLGWTLQGPSSVLHRLERSQQCLLTSIPPSVNELMRHVEKLWRADIIPLRSDKLVTRSKQDNQALSLLEAKTDRVEVDGMLRYATPLLRCKDMPCLQATPEAVMSSLRGVEKRLRKDPEKAEIYQSEMNKLIKAGYVLRVEPKELKKGDEAWYIPHHLVSHNGKHRLVFNCSFQHRGQTLNNYLLPGPTLGSSLLGVLLRFREHAVAVSGDIKAMFHQVRLLPEDRPLLRFLWRNQQPEEPPAVYEWQVLPFGTTCSPCCATFALQRHAKDHRWPGEEVRTSIERCFYVDNCLHSVPTATEARELVDQLRALLSSAGFVLRQWASNESGAIDHLSEEDRSDSAELWLAESKTESPESTLGHSWHFASDVLGYKHRPVQYAAPTMRIIYRVLASQYDPLGFILPYTTRAKMLVRHLWDKNRGWDDPQLPPDLLQQWNSWERELQFLPEIRLPRPYLPADITWKVKGRELHVFCDASEQAYGAVAYLRIIGEDDQAHVSFVMARSRVAPKRLHSIPRLELCAALVGAQLSKLLAEELSLHIGKTVMWTDSTTVLTWLKSESCRFKVFVGTCIAEIQELTNLQSWRYVESAQNPADDITRGKTLQELARPNRWSQGPPILHLPRDQWPKDPTDNSEISPDASELRRSILCAVTSAPTAYMGQYETWQELLDATVQELHGAAKDICPTAEDYRQAERLLLKRAQRESFPKEFDLLTAGKPVQRSSRLLTLSPELDDSGELIRVGGRLRHAEDLTFFNIHPLVLDPSHPVTKLIIQDCDRRLRHPGPERVFAQLRRHYWILKGREAIRRFQRTCADCQRWRARPTVPKMADLPLARLRLFKPAFFSTGTDCFGPFEVKVGRRLEKRWGIIFKCMTVRAVHLDVLTCIDTDSFLMALRRFISRRGTPAELYSDQGTNFRGGDAELREAFSAMTLELQQLLAPHKIRFHFNPPAAPHFGGVWEREIRSVKTALYATVGAQPITEEVLCTVLVEVEGILNSKPLGYVSSDVRDPDPVTPNCLLMGRRDSSLPQVVYSKEELLSRRRWRHAQVLADHFWARFIRLYLPGLQARQKWQTSTDDIREGTVVMIVDPHLPRALWPVGHINKVHPSPDGHIRSADVKIKDRTYTRPVARLVILPAIPDDDTDLKAQNCLI